MLSQTKIAGKALDCGEASIYVLRCLLRCLVRMPDSLNFGLDESELRPISDRVAIYCM